MKRINRGEIQAIKRDNVSRGDLEDALKQVLLAEPDERPKSENREPTRKELVRRYRLEWR